MRKLFLWSNAVFCEKDDILSSWFCYAVIHAGYMKGMIRLTSFFIMQWNQTILSETTQCLQKSISEQHLHTAKQFSCAVIMIGLIPHFQEASQMNTPNHTYVFADILTSLIHRISKIYNICIILYMNTLHLAPHLI